MELFTLIVLLVFVCGLVIGSFLNAAIYRIPRKIPFMHFSGKYSRSVCPQCHHAIGVVDLIPVLSFLLLRGKCRFCKHRISWQYPVVELLTGVVVVLPFLQFGLSSQSIIVALLALCLLFIFLYDLKYQLILDASTILLALISFFASLFVFQRTPADITIGAFIGAGFFLLQYIVSRGRWVGSGDVWLGGAIGLMLGAWQTGLMLLLAYIIGSVVAIFLIVTRRVHAQSRIPLGIFLTSSAYVSLLCGEELIHYYTAWVL